MFELENETDSMTNKEKSMLETISSVCKKYNLNNIQLAKVLGISATSLYHTPASRKTISLPLSALFEMVDFCDRNNVFGTLLQEFSGNNPGSTMTPAEREIMYSRLGIKGSLPFCNAEYMLVLNCGEHVPSDIRNVTGVPIKKVEQYLRMKNTLVGWMPTLGDGIKAFING